MLFTVVHEHRTPMMSDIEESADKPRGPPQGTLGLEIPTNLLVRADEVIE
jgi:hypothetical protein